MRSSRTNSTRTDASSICSSSEGPEGSEPFKCPSSVPSVCAFRGRFVRRLPTPFPGRHPIRRSNLCAAGWETATTRSPGTGPGMIPPPPLSRLGPATPANCLCALRIAPSPNVSNASVASRRAACAASRSSSSMYVSALDRSSFAGARSPRLDRNAEGAHPSLEPTVLWYPALNPPSNAPWNRRLPSASVGTWRCAGSALVVARADALGFFCRYDRDASSRSREVPTTTKSSESESIARLLAGAGARGTHDPRARGRSARLRTRDIAKRPSHLTSSGGMTVKRLGGHDGANDAHVRAEKFYLVPVTGVCGTTYGTTVLYLRRTTSRTTSPSLPPLARRRRRAWIQPRDRDPSPPR